MQRTAGNRATASLLASPRGDAAPLALQRVSFSYVAITDGQAKVRRFKKVEMTDLEVAMGDNGGDRKLGVHTSGAFDCAIILTWDGKRTVSVMHPIAHPGYGSAAEDAKKAVKIVAAASKVVLVLGSFYKEETCKEAAQDHLAAQIIAQAGRTPDETHVGHNSAAMMSDGTVLLSPDTQPESASEKKKGCILQ